MNLSEMKRIAHTMVEHGGLLPEFVTDDFEFTIVAHPTSHPAAGRPQSASEILPGLERARDLFRYPDEYGPGDGLKTIVRSITAEGDRVVVEAETHAVPRANPADRYTNFNVAIYVFRDGKVAQARIYEDTAYVQTQLPDALIDSIAGRRPIGGDRPYTEDTPRA
jgi:ketosteroid isomerase-like protein